MPMSVCVCVCLFVCVFVCVFVCPCFRKISKCNISAISQPIIMKLGIHITYGYTVTDKYFQNFRSKVKVVGSRKVKNVIWPYLGNEWSQRFGIGVKMQGNIIPTTFVFGILVYALQFPRSNGVEVRTPHMKLRYKSLVARRARSAISDCLVLWCVCIDDRRWLRYHLAKVLMYRADRRVFIDQGHVSKQSDTLIGSQLTPGHWQSVADSQVGAWIKQQSNKIIAMK